jgi:hypothetical protein
MKNSSNKIMSRFFLIILTILTFDFAFTQNSKNNFKIYPVNESKYDSSLSAFIDNLKIICERKDTASLYKVLDAGIVTSYGADLIGKKDFINYHNLNKPDSTYFWNEIISLINLGGVFDSIDNRKFFCFPYATSIIFDLNTVLDSTQRLDAPFNIMICIKDKVPVYNIPDISSQIVAYLSYDIVVKDYKISKQTETNFSMDNWEYVSTMDKKIKGWIMHKNFYNLTGPNLMIEKINGTWKITCYCSYD